MTKSLCSLHRELRSVATVLCFCSSIHHDLGLHKVWDGLTYFDVSFEKECYDAIVSVESLHHFTKEQKCCLYRKAYQPLPHGGYFILTDYFAETDEQEQFYRQELLRLKSEQGIYDNEFYHYDTPLTKANELQVLNEAGFSSTEILAEWGATATIKAVK